MHTFPVTTGRQSVSPGAGTDPQWAPDGRTLYYRNRTTFFAVDVITDPSFLFGPPDELFDYPAFVGESGDDVPPYWDVHPEGDRFILTETRGTAVEASGGGDAVLGPAQRLEDVYIVVNWFTELKALMGS